jgi:uncharacterized surface protein with fasciclin (FAS1) repeats
MKKIITKILTLITLVGLVGLASCKKLNSFDYPPAEGTPYEIITDDITYASFKLAVDRAGLQSMFNSETEYTFFLPTTAALTASGYSAAFLQGMPAADAAALVKNHIVAGKINVGSVTTPLTTLSGKQIAITPSNGRYLVDGSDILRSDISAKKSNINVINNTLTSVNSLLEAVTNYQHATTTLKLDMTLAAITRASTGSVNFTNLLSGTDNYTFFAPTNAAWTDAGYSTLALINAAPVATLVDILRYHIIPGAKLTSAFDSVGVASYAGTNIYFDRFMNVNTTQFYANGILFGNGGSNIVATNGVVHIVPRVLRVPVLKNTLQQIQGDATLSVFYAAVLRASTADPAFDFQSLLSGTRSYTVFAVNNAGMAAAGFANVAAVNAAAPVDLARIIKYHIIPRRVNNINLADNATLSTLLITANSTGAPVSNALTFTAMANAPTAYRIKGPGNTATIAVSPANITTTNGILNVVASVLVP